MPKIQTSSLRRKAQHTFTRTLECSTSGVKDEIVFRVLTKAETLAAADEAEEMIAQYVTGAPGKPAEPLPPIDGQPVHISPTAFRIAAIVAYAQEAQGEDRYSTLDMALLMASDDLCSQIAAIASDVQTPAPDDGEGNSGSSSGS